MLEHSNPSAKVARSRYQKYRVDLQTHGEVQLEFYRAAENAVIDPVRRHAASRLGIGGVNFSGIDTLMMTNEPWTYMETLVRQGKMRILPTKKTPDGKVICKAVRLDDKGEEVAFFEVVFDPVKQFSIVEQCVQNSSGEVVELGRADMEDAGGSGVFFPKFLEAAKFDSGTTKSLIRTTFSDVSVNKPLTDEEFNLMIPAGTLIQDSVNDGGGTLRKDTSAADLLMPRK